MRILPSLILLVLFWASTARAADTNSSWKLIRDLKETATNPKEFKFLKNAHSEHFSATDADSVTYASLKLKTFLWVGETSCHPDDARLNFTTEERVVCAVEEQGSIGCSSYISGLPAESDPCL